MGKSTRLAAAFGAACLLAALGLSPAYGAESDSFCYNSGTLAFVPCTSAVPLAVQLSGGGTTQAVNLSQVAGAAVQTGHGTAAGSVRVELPTDGTGIVGLAAGANVIGAVTQSGIWTVQPGNTANTTPWLFTINQGGNSAVVSVAGALKTDGSAVTQPVSGAVTANAGTGTFTVAGTVTANAGTGAFSVVGTAADNSVNSTTKIPVLVARANAAVQTWTEGNEVPASVDLNGAMRTVVTSAGAAANVLSPGDATAIGSSLSVVAAIEGYNGTNFDRIRTAPGTTGVLSVNTEGTKASYRWAGSVTPAATPTDVITLQGSGTKTIRITRVSIDIVSTAGGIADVVLIRRSTAATGGTSTGGPVIGKLDTNDAAATLSPLLFTANPTVGTGVANLGTCKVGFVTSGSLAPCEFIFGTRNAKELLLRGTADFLAINGQADALLTGEVWAFDIEWTEE